MRELLALADYGAVICDSASYYRKLLCQPSRTELANQITSYMCVKSMEFVSVAALAENRVIGKDSEVPWHIPEDRRQYRSLIADVPVILGRGCTSR